ncbi:MAG: hypothetical protein HQ554_05400 [FCB group bacterium]|nr:hypothetical protein [FCB group bacterium]
MDLEMVEVIAVRKLIIALILLSIPLLILSAEHFLIFSEAGSGLRLEKQFIEESETELFTTFSTELQTTVSRLAIDGSVYTFTNFDSLSSWQTGIIYERLFPLIDISVSGYYISDENDSLDITNAAIKLFKQNESQKDFNEYGLRSKRNSFFNNNAFSNLEFNIYYIYKKFLKDYTIHNEFNAVTKYFTDTDPLLNVNYQITFSFPTNDYSGINLSYFINYNPIDNNEILYLNEELFDLFSYNMHKFSIEHTTIKGNLLFKPWLAFNSKEYLTTAVEYPYSETSFLAGIYADWLMADGFMAYTEGFYQAINGDPEIAYEFVTGLKIQFDLISR